MKYEIGTALYDGDCRQEWNFQEHGYQKKQILGYCMANGIQYYVVDYPHENGRVYGDMYTEDAMAELMEKQDWFLAEIQRMDAEKQAQEQAEKEAAEAREKELSLFGYAENFSGVKLSRIQSVLLKKLRYDGKIMTRAEHIKSVIDAGGKVESKFFRNWKTGKEKECFCLYEAGENSIFWEITKTEYSFAEWLIDQRGTMTDEEFEAAFFGVA